ncbi:Retrovirus-related Pol polyprotein from transposon TNT 1-94 [Eumeta japonica]|uniref:Retrovirus-related Pol polyprotein from transposon TNT 1-94 n=1 Tax=Eumeta variegata TaxID=151549 RepID=A0A4C1ZIU7_EUMVA|nr:Retrovirus-related Pol polyprotein from transposon TNT 1-94 [Eumeta japonica]
MSSNNSLVLIEKLTGRENYGTWRFAVKTYLEHEELWNCIERSGEPENSDVDEQDVYIWHQRMGHLNFQDLTKIVENTNGVKISKKDDKLTCLTCLEGKQKRLPFKHSESKTIKLLELVHSDICGPMETRSLEGANYFMTFIDDYSKKVTNKITETQDTRRNMDKKKPNIHHLKVFGCEAMIHLPKEKRKKWDSKAQKAIFIGYCEHTKGYRFLLPGSRTVIKNKDAMFLESTVKKNYVPVDLTIDSSMYDLSSEPNDTSEISDTNETSQTTNTEYFLESNTSSSSEYSPNQTFKTPPRLNITLKPRNKELRKKLNYEQSYLCCNEDVSVPFNYSEAIASPDSEKWKTSIRKELEAHHQNGIWTLIEKPPNAKSIGSKWIFQIKDETTGPRFKARLCAKGYAQQEGIDYNETFSPTVRYDSIRLLISIAAQEKLEIVQFDVTTAFLYGQLHENILMTPPEGLDCKPNMVCKLVKSLYGLKQAPSIPADPHVKLQKADDKPKKDHPYREAVGSLIHAAAVSRPDIMFAVSQVSRYLHSYDDSHWNAVMKILKYLKETKDHGLNYMSECTDLIGYSDADFANDIETRRSITGYVFLKNGAAVTWSTQRQQTVALSTTKSEFMAVCAATKEAIWLRQLLCDILISPGSVQIETVVGKEVVIESGTGNRIENGTKIRIESGRGTETKNGTRSKTNVGTRSKSNRDRN